jgi:hypothetical protein
VTPPPEWPSNVRPISTEGISLLGIEPATKKLYWDGREIVVRDRLRLGGWANFLAILVAIGTFGSFIVELVFTMKLSVSFTKQTQGCVGRRQ